MLRILGYISWLEIGERDQRNPQGLVITWSSYITAKGQRGRGRGNIEFKKLDYFN